MLDTVVLICLGIISLAMVLTFVRLVRGPDLPDRILALDTLYINAIARKYKRGSRNERMCYFRVTSSKT